MDELFKLLNTNQFKDRLKFLILTKYAGNNSKLAKELGVNEAKIRSYLKGTLPKIDFLEKLYDILDINLEWIIKGKGSETNHTENIDLSSEPIKERLLTYLEQTDCDTKDFIKDNFLDDDFFTTKKEKNISSYELAIICESEPLLNLYWLVLGDGEMLLTQQQGLGVATTTQQQEPTAEQQRLEDKVRYLESMLATQQKLIASYEQQLNIQGNSKQQAG